MQRNLALKWLKYNTKDGVIYFADDDNAFNVKLFEEIRSTKKVAILPVGNFAKTAVSSPIVKHGKVVGFLDPWFGGRKFPVDMASLAIGLPFWLKRGSPMFKNTKRGYTETLFLESLNITLADFEPKASNATVVLAWHTKTLLPEKAIQKNAHLEHHRDTNLPVLLKDTVWSP